MDPPQCPPPLEELKELKDLTLHDVRSTFSSSTENIKKALREWFKKTGTGDERLSLLLDVEGFGKGKIYKLLKDRRLDDDPSTIHPREFYHHFGASDASLVKQGLDPQGAINRGCQATGPLFHAPVLEELSKRIDAYDHGLVTTDELAKALTTKEAHKGYVETRVYLWKIACDPNPDGQYMAKIGGTKDTVENRAGTKTDGPCDPLVLFKVCMPATRQHVISQLIHEGSGEAVFVTEKLIKNITLHRHANLDKSTGKRKRGEANETRLFSPSEYEKLIFTWMPTLLRYIAGPHGFVCRTELKYADSQALAKIFR